MIFYDMRYVLIGSLWFQTIIIATRDIMFNDVRRNYALLLSTVKTMTVDTALKCMQYCVLNEACYSVNYNKEDGTCKHLRQGSILKSISTCANSSEHWIYYGSKTENGMVYAVCAIEEQSPESMIFVSTFPTLKRTWLLSFDVKVNTLRSGWRNLMAAFVTGQYEKGVPGQRYPAIFFPDNSTELYICSYIDNNFDYCFTGTPYVLQLGVYSNIQIMQYQDGSVYKYKITIDGAVKDDIILSVEPSEFNDVEVYMYRGNPVDANIKNFVYQEL